MPRTVLPIFAWVILEGSNPGPGIYLERPENPDGKVWEHQR